MITHHIIKQEREDGHDTFIVERQAKGRFHVIPICLYLTESQTGYEPHFFGAFRDKAAVFISKDDALHALASHEKFSKTNHMIVKETREEIK